MSGDKEAIRSSVYYNIDTGFGSIAKTLEGTKRLDPSITRDEANSFLGKQATRQKKKPARYNSFIPPFPREQYQVDLDDFGTDGEYRYAFVCIDAFTKLLAALPLKTKASAATAKALDAVL